MILMKTFKRSDFDEELLQVRKANIEKQAKEKADRVNIDEIPSGPVDIDTGFEDISKNKGVIYEGKLGGDDPYFDSSDSGSDISNEKEGDPIDDDEVVDPLPRTFSSKIYFDKTTKNVCFQLYMVVLNAIEFREALQSYYIQKSVNLKLDPNEKKRVRAKCILLSCISKDGNNQMYPVAWAVVDKGTKDTWSWFLRCIIHDLELEENGGEDLTVMSDMQKGLHLALTNLLPNAEHRWCARHIWANWKPVWSVVNVKRKQCSCRSWQLKRIPCAHAIAAMHYKGWNVESYVDHWYQRKTYLKAYEKYIQPMTNINMWPRSKRPPIEPPEITPMSGRLGKNRKKTKDEAKKDFSSSCGSQPSVQASTSTIVATTERDANASTAEEMPVNNKSRNRRPVGRPSNAQSAPTCSERPAYDHSGPTAAGRHANAASVDGVRPARASTADIRPATIVMPTTTSAVGATATQSTTQLSTSVVGAQKRKTSTTLRGGANLAYKRPRQKKEKEAGFGVLFRSSSSVVERYGNTDRVLHSPTLIYSVPTNIDLGFKPNGLRWKGGAAITPRQLQQQNNKRSKAKSSPTTQATSSTQASKNNPQQALKKHNIRVLATLELGELKSQLNLLNLCVEAYDDKAVNWSTSNTSIILFVALLKSECPSGFPYAIQFSNVFYKSIRKYLIQLLMMWTLLKKRLEVFPSMIEVFIRLLFEAHYLIAKSHSLTYGKNLLRNFLAKSSYNDNVDGIRPTYGVHTWSNGPIPDCPPGVPPLVAFLVEHGFSVTPSSENTKVGQFIRLNPLVFTGIKVEKNPQGFIDEMENIFYVMHITIMKGVDFSTYQLKDVAYKWYKEWEQSMGDDAESALWDNFFSAF
ncbi:hypothetical protein FXO38_15522 [Capsicum annuum]|nr:hypothetical protein FXO38_15522 [Capsicum annuum]